MFHYAILMLYSHSLTILITNTLIIAIVGWLEVVLGRQKRNDFRPKDAELQSVATSLATGPCGQCCEYLKKLQQKLSKLFDGPNLESILVEISLKFFSLLLDHIRKFIINSNGGLLLTK